MPFWRDLKQGYDAFEATQLPPRIAVCNGAYTFAPALPPSDGSHEIVDTLLELDRQQGVRRRDTPRYGPGIAPIMLKSEVKHVDGSASCA